MATLAAYSFMNIQCTLSGPSVQASLGYGAQNAKEGISFEMLEDKDMMMIGADGAVMHSLRMGNGARFSVRLMKTSPMNNTLSIAYNFQRLNAGFWGQNTLVVSDVQRGDLVAGSSVAFARHPGVTWAEDGNINEWTFYGNVTAPLLGLGTFDVNL
jgi:hypothetical protein